MFKNYRVKLAAYLHKKLQQHIENHPPDFTVGKDYLRRWYLIPRNPFFNIYYHNFRVSDDDRAFHDHMYLNLSFLLHGGYLEYTPNGVMMRFAGDFKIRIPWTLHRLQLFKDSDTMQPMHCWSLFITGPRIRKWGFQIGPIVRNWLGFRTKSGWMYHEDYMSKYGDQLNN